MEFEIIDKYMQEAIVDLVGVGEYGKDAANYIKNKGITGLTCKESVSESLDFDLIFVIASLKELKNATEETYRPTEYRKSYETISYLYVKSDNNIDFCNSKQLTKLHDYFDVIIPITNKSDDIESIYCSIRGITELITTNGLVGIDFADIRMTSKKMGIGITSYGLATGYDKYIVAAKGALELLLTNQIDLKTLKAFIVSIIADMDIEIDDLDKVGQMVRNLTSDDAVVLVGLTITAKEGNDICVSITANGVCN